MEPEPGSVRETDSTATFVHDAQQDTIADEPIPTQCLPTTDLLLLLLRTSQTPPPETGSHYATSYVTVVRKQNYFTVLWEEPNRPTSGNGQGHIDCSSVHFFYLTRTWAGT